MRLGQVMLYVNNQELCRDFWVNNFDFKVKNDHSFGDLRFIELYSEDGGTEIVLHNKDFIAKMEPELFLGTPSLVFYTDNLTALYKKLKGNNVNVGEILDHFIGSVFNFSDDEGNYFAVSQK